MKRKFYVGCRVKIVRAPNDASVLGLHATIIGHSTDWPGSWSIDIDGCPPKFPYTGWAAWECNLEPLWPGSEKTTWAECMWKPVPLGKRKLETA